ncbi:hypothetical protein [Rathayibacter sp. AY2B3]|uniref:phage tail protein n=1 Tax=Rathayibacter sp. AY2B3 TaxID=2080569 RepID=UPI0011B0D73D|nr:hypothetical protein [Rathayibacter sp. AY2B3]
MAHLKINVDADMRPAERTIKRFIDHWDGQTITMNAAVDAGVASTRMAVLTRPRNISVTASLAPTSVAKIGSALAALSGARLGADLFKGIGERLANLDRALPKIAAVASSIASLAAVGISAGGGLATLAASLSSILAVSALAPALIVGAGVSVAVLAVALSQMGDRLGDVIERWKGLGDVIGDGFWDQAAQPLRELSDSIFPGIRDGLEGTASALGSWTASLAEGFQSALSGAALEQLFGRLNESIAIASGGTGAFTSALVDLGLVGSDYLPRLAQWISDLTTRFGEFVGAAAADGSLKGWIDGGITAAKELGSVLFSAGSIISSIADAAQAAGGGGLATLASGLAGIAEAVASSGAQEALSTLFGGAAEGATGLATALGPIASLFGVLAPVLADIMSGAGAGIGGLFSQVAEALSQPVFTTGLTEFFDGLLAGIDGIAPALPAVAEALGAFGSFAGELASNVGPLLGELLTVLAPLFTDILTAVQPLLPVLADGLTEAIRDLAPVVLPLISELLPKLVDLFIAAVPVIVDVIRAVSELKPVLDFLIDVVEFGIGMWTALLKVLGDPTAFNDLQGFIKSVGGPFGDFMQFAFDAGQQFGQTVRDIVDGFAGMVGDGMANVRDFVNSAISFVNSGISGINSALSGLSAIGLNISIPGIPELADGATINPREGGTVVRVAEAGRAESVVDTGLLNRHLAASLQMQMQLAQQSATPPAIYVQNPWTAEYHEARMADVSDRRIGSSNEWRDQDAGRGRW